MLNALAVQGNRMLATALTTAAAGGDFTFMTDGNMTVGVIRDDLIVRVGKDAYAEALTRPGTREFDFTGRP